MAKRWVTVRQSKVREEVTDRSVRWNGKPLPAGIYRVIGILQRWQSPRRRSRPSGKRRGR